MTDPLVLAIDDEAPILGIIRLTLETAGFRVISAATAEEGLALDQEHTPDAVVLDLVLPDVPGMQVFQSLKARREVPIVIITADVTKGSETLPDDVADYLVKPFEPDELAQAVREVLETPDGRRPRRMIRAGDVEIDQAKGVAVRAGVIVPLTTAERSLLRHLAENPGARMSGGDLLTRTWGDDYADDHEFLALWISRLRQKIEVDPADPQVITGTATGYTLEAYPSA